MTRFDMEKRDRLAYLALYYAIHGEADRSENLRLALRQFRPEEKKRELVPVMVKA